MSSLFYALNIEDNHIKKINDYKNSPSTKRSNQAKDKEQIKYSHKESFKRENKSLLNYSKLIKIYITKSYSYNLNFNSINNKDSFYFLFNCFFNEVF